MQNETAKRFLESLTIASPCEMSWDEMTGDEQARFCNQCQKNVYNISEMTRFEAEILIREHEGNVCVRMYRRQDGTVINDDCPVGLRTLRSGYRFMKARVWQVAAAAAAVFSGVFTVPSVAQNQVSKSEKQDSKAEKQNSKADEKPSPQGPSPVKEPRQLMGKIACPQPTEAQLKAEEGYKKAVAQKIAAVLPKGTTLTKGSIYFQIGATGEVKNCIFSESTGDTKLDDRISAAVKSTKVVVHPEGIPAYRSVVLKLSELERAAK